MREKNYKRRGTLGFVTPTRSFSLGKRIYLHPSSGRVADALAGHYDRLLICSRVMGGPPPSAEDIPLESANVHLIAQPPWRKTVDALPHICGIARAYLRTCRRSDVLLIRGMCPYVAILYLLAFLYRRPICHWIVGDPVALLKTSRRGNRLTNALLLLYAIQDRAVSRAGRWLTGGSFICNGAALSRAYRSDHTLTVASSTVRDREFCAREDTCQGSPVRILYVGYLRPEKGIEFLLHAVSALKLKKPWELHLVGSAEFPGYHQNLLRMVAALKIEGTVHWHGYVSYGEPLFAQMRRADILVLPSLSEGTPHVLVEARANGLPCISTTVGGVPSAVTHEYDALLVESKNADALGRAIERIAIDGQLRRKLIRNGLAAARLQTLERFVAIVQRELENKFGMKQRKIWDQAPHESGMSRN